MTAVAGAALLAVKDVNVRFESLLALRQVTIEVPEGSAVGLIGPNGAGKSTLLAVIGGQQRPSSGRVEFFGRDISRRSPDARARMGLRRTFQALELFDEMTVRDNILAALGGVGFDPRRGGGSRAMRHAVDALIHDLDLGAYEDATAGALPAPVRRWVSYARALAGQPKCLLLDEPAAGLSEADRSALARRIKEDVARTGMSAIVVEHNMGFVRHLCDRIYFLNAGMVLMAGTFEEVAANADVREAYLGRPPGEHES